MNAIVPGQLRIYIVAIILTLFAPIARVVVRFIFRHFILPIAAKTKNPLDDAVMQSSVPPLSWGAFIIFIGMALKNLPAGASTERAIHVVFITSLGLIATWLLFNWIDAVSAFLEEKALETASRLDNQLLPVVRKSLKFFIAVIAVVVILQNMGYNISGLVAGLGIGGLAVALAAQETLSNLFGSIMIFLDRPFQVGDFVQVGSISGIVEDVGFRSTRIRSFEKSLISVPNAIIAKTAIDNYSRRDLRRAKMTVGLTYDTPPEGVTRGVEIIREILTEHPKIESGNFVVAFNELAASSLNIFVQFFVTTTDWDVYLTTQQEVNTSILQRFSDEGLSFAFPTQTIQLVDSR